MKQFLGETKAVSRLTSPHTVTLYDAGRLEDGAPFLAMELLEGRTLRARLADGPCEVEEAIRIVDGIALSLSQAHARGIVHRDVKPSNVLLAKTPGHAPTPKLLDFGLARLADGAPPERRAAGTLRYMAPEALRGEEVDARADVYGLAMLTTRCSPAPARTRLRIGTTTRSSSRSSSRCRRRSTRCATRRFLTRR